MLTQLQRAKLSFEIMEMGLLRKHTYMQMILASNQLKNDGHDLPWFDLNTFKDMKEPIKQLTLVQKDLLFRNFYSYLNVYKFVDTWYARHENVINAFRTQPGWNESEFYFNLTQKVDTPVSLLNAYRDFMLLAYSSNYDSPKFSDGLPRVNNAPSRNVSNLFITLYEDVINEGLVRYNVGRVSDTKFKKISALALPVPLTLHFKELINGTVSGSNYCEIATRTQVNVDPFKNIFGVEFHKYLPSIFDNVMGVLKNAYASANTQWMDRNSSSYYRASIRHLLADYRDRQISLVEKNWDIFRIYLLKHMNVGNKNITKQSILNKLAIFVKQFNTVLSVTSFAATIFQESYYRSFNFEDYYDFNKLPLEYRIPNYDTVPNSKAWSCINWVLNTLTFDKLDTMTTSTYSVTSMTVFKDRMGNNRFRHSHLKPWNNFITDLNEYLNFKSTNKTFLINLHPAAMINASLGYGGWSSCHSYVSLPTSEMIDMSNGSFPYPHHSYWMGNYQLALGNAFVIVEVPKLVKEKQYLVPNLVRTMTWVSEDLSSIRMNLPYPTRQMGSVPNEMSVEYTAIRERMASIFKPFIKSTDTQTWVRSTSNGMQSTNDVTVGTQNEYTSSVAFLDVNGNVSERSYAGYSGESLQSVSVVKEVVASYENKTIRMIHSGDVPILNNEFLSRGANEEQCREVNKYAELTYEQNGGFSETTYISWKVRNDFNFKSSILEYGSNKVFNQTFLIPVDDNKFLSYATFLQSQDNIFFCEDTKKFSTSAIKVYVSRQKQFLYYSKDFNGAMQCSISKEYFLPSLMVGDISIFESLKNNQIEWTFIQDAFVSKATVLVHDNRDLLLDFLNILATKTNYLWASGKKPNEYIPDTTKAIVFTGGVLKIKSIADLKGYNIVDVKNLVFKL